MPDELVAAVTIAPTCPWDAFDPATLQFCERQICGWITQPSNTWSNIAYLIVGVIVLRLAARENAPHLAPIGWIAIAVSLGSTFFHASSTFLGEVFDVGAMFLFSVFWLMLDLKRLLAWSARTQTIFFATMTVASIVLLLVQRPMGIAIFSVQITCTFLIEAALIRRARRAHAGARSPRVDYRPLRRLSLMFLLAYAAWRLDYHRIVCAPDFHVLSGHAVWHLLNSFCFYFLYRFFRQFPQRHGT